jgi:hypothetical protein
VQILCMQEVFTTPYFCAEQQTVGMKRSSGFPTGRPCVCCRKSQRNTAW